MFGRNISTVLLAVILFGLGVIVSAFCPCESPPRSDDSYYDSYDPLKAYRLMQYSYYTYDMKPTRQLPAAFRVAFGKASPVPHKIISGPLPWIQGGEMLGIVGYDSFLKGIIVAFRGTNKASHWMANLRATSTRPEFLPPGVPGDVHTGFLNAYMGVRDQVHEEVERLWGAFSYFFGSGVPNLFFTGHSLGGAMASLAAADFARELARSVPITVYTFASPRVGDTCFVSYFTRVIHRSFRVVVDGDSLVPHMPMKRLKLNCQFESMPGKVRVPRPFVVVNVLTAPVHMHPSYLKQLSLLVGYTPSGLELNTRNRPKGESLPVQGSHAILEQAARQCVTGGRRLMLRPRWLRRSRSFSGPSRPASRLSSDSAERRDYNSMYFD